MFETPDVEITGDHQAPPTTGPRPSAYEVTLAALAQAMPCERCGATTEACEHSERWAPDRRAEFIVEALRAYGWIAAEEPGEVEFDPEAVAKFLADRSGFPRYVDVPEGWRRLLESDRDVDVAFTYAQKRIGMHEVEAVKAARSSLLAWHQDRR